MADSQFVYGAVCAIFLCSLINCLKKLKVVFK